MVGDHERPISASLEHYVDAVFALRRERGYARVSDVAERLSVNKATVSAAMRSLEGRGLVRFGAHRFLELSAGGERLAASLESRNAILRRFLTEVLGVPRRAAEVDACRMEHAVGRATIDRLVDLIRFFEEPRLRPVLGRFRAFRRSCAADARCASCEFGCTVQGLVALRPAAAARSRARPKRKARRARAFGAEKRS
jgi:DtxR family Mn-dependent transcriptional regulator